MKKFNLWYSYKRKVDGIDQKRGQMMNIALIDDETAILEDVRKMYLIHI